MRRPVCIAAQRTDAASRGAENARFGLLDGLLNARFGLLDGLPPHTLQVIAKAKVPIVKFEDAETGYAFDVSFDVANGPEVRFCLPARSPCAARMHMKALIHPGAIAPLLVCLCTIEGC